MRFFVVLWAWFGMGRAEAGSLTRSAASTEEASINGTNIKTDVIVFAYNVNKQNAARGKQSAAEACAKLCFVVWCG